MGKKHGEEAEANDQRGNLQKGVFQGEGEAPDGHERDFVWNGGGFAAGNGFDGERGAGFLIGLALGTAVCLGAFCGMNRVSMTAWRSGKAEYAEFFGGYTPGGFARCILPAVIGGMMLTLMRRFVLGGSWWLALITAAVLCVARMLAGCAMYGMNVLEGNLPQAAARGLQVGMKHFGQILEMEIRLYWWHVAVIAGTVLLCGACGASGLATGLILLTEGAVGSYNALAEAGLFRTLLAGE